MRAAPCLLVSSKAILAPGSTALMNLFSHDDFQPDRDISVRTEERQLNRQHPPQSVEPCACVDSLEVGLPLI